MQSPRYTWDEHKAAQNHRLHGIAFEDATKIFDGPTLEQLDDRFEYPEDRWYAIRLVNGLPVTVIFTDFDDQTHRIVSAATGAS